MMLGCTDPRTTHNNVPFCRQLLKEIAASLDNWVADLEEDWANDIAAAIQEGADPKRMFAQLPASIQERAKQHLAESKRVMDQQDIDAQTARDLTEIEHGDSPRG
jgi:hypothetical protein